MNKKYWIVLLLLGLFALPGFAQIFDDEPMSYTNAALSQLTFGGGPSLSVGQFFLEMSDGRFAIHPGEVLGPLRNAQGLFHPTYLDQQRTEAGRPWPATEPPPPFVSLRARIGGGFRYLKVDPATDEVSMNSVGADSFESFFVGDVLPPLSVITLGLSPNQTAEVTTTASAILLDVRTGYVYGSCESTSRKNQLASAWTSGEAVDFMRLKTERQAFEELLGEFEALWRESIDKNAGGITAGHTSP